MQHKENKFTKFFNNLNPLTLLFALVLIVSLLTYIIPAGEYDRMIDEESGRTLVVPGTYHTIESNPATPITFFMSYVSSGSDSGHQSAGGGPGLPAGGWPVQHSLGDQRYFDDWPWYYQDQLSPVV